MYIYMYIYILQHVQYRKIYYRMISWNVHYGIISRNIYTYITELYHGIILWNYITGLYDGLILQDYLTGLQ